VDVSIRYPDVELGRDLAWWRPEGLIGGTAVRSLEVVRDLVLDTDWCTVHRISVGQVPHQVRFCRDRHTLMVFDKGSFVQGERRIDGKPLSTSGPLDLGLDAVPAHAEFHGLAGAGSTINCTLISIDGNKVDEGKPLPAALLRPAINLGGELLQPLVTRLRQLMWRDKSCDDSLYFETLCLLLFREVLFAQRKDGEGLSARYRGGLSGSAQRVIREFIEENLDQRICLDSLAKEVGVSRFHFARAFKVSFGVSPHKYLLDLRIGKAANLLCGTQEPIIDIALRVGFPSQSEFSRTFKQAMQCTPREFRQRGR